MPTFCGCLCGTRFHPGRTSDRQDFLDEPEGGFFRRVVPEPEFHVVGGPPHYFVVIEYFGHVEVGHGVFVVCPEELFRRLSLYGKVLCEDGFEISPLESEPFDGEGFVLGESSERFPHVRVLECVFHREFGFCMFSASVFGFVSRGDKR